MHNYYTNVCIQRLTYGVVEWVVLVALDPSIQVRFPEGNTICDFHTYIVCKYTTRVCIKLWVYRAVSVLWQCIYACMWKR